MSTQSLRQRLFRTKNIPQGDLQTNLRRCLNTFDITMLGVGTMIGAGIYVLSGAVIRNTAGPSIVLSFLLSGIAALFSALCYAEFGARFPKAGSAYTYAYVGCGELWAFIIGWNVVLEQILGSAAVARSWSGYFDALIDHRVSNFTIANFGRMGGHGSLIAEYPDIVAVIVILVPSIFIILGSKTATSFNSLFVCTNLCVIVFVVGYGSTFIDFSNWQGMASDGVHSRFMPYGVNGMLQGAATCLFAYIGFDGLATAGEEAKDPARAIPHATYISMAIVSVAYILMSGVLSLMVPYEKVDVTSAFADAFALHGSPWGKYVVSVGAICGMTTSMMGSLFAMPRCVYAMAEDGLIFRWWAVVNQKTKTPINAIVTFTILTALVGMFFDLEALVDFLAIGNCPSGTLLAYTLVAASLIILRYQPAPISPNEPHILDNGGQLRVRFPFLVKLLRNIDPSYSIYYALLIMIASMTVFGILLSTAFYSNPFGLILFIISILLIISSVVFIDLHHQNKQNLAFKVFWVPYLPSASLLINLLMMTHLGVMTWIRLAVWLAIGLAIYLLYGLRHSNEEQLGAERLTKASTMNSVVVASTISDPVKQIDD